MKLTINEIREKLKEFEELRAILKANNALPRTERKAKAKAEKPATWVVRYQPTQTGFQKTVEQFKAELDYLFNFTKKTVPTPDGKHLGSVSITFNLIGNVSDYTVSVISKSQKTLRMMYFKERAKAKAKAAEAETEKDEDEDENEEDEEIEG